MEPLTVLFLILKNWWWIIISILSALLFKYFFFWWMNWEIYYPRTFKWILLEIKPPKENVQPFSAMENIFAMLWGIIDVPNWRERWCSGAPFLGGGGWFSIEIVSIGGEIHFYLRVPDFFKEQTESILYSFYPDLEISEVEDYVKKIPPNIPDENWDLRAEDYTLARPDHFPIKTYSSFFERPEEEKRVVEEKRLDPMNNLLEGLSILYPSEQIWFQIVCNPIVDATFPWMGSAREELARLLKRPVPPKRRSILVESILKFFDIFLYGASKSEGQKGMELIAPELRLSPGEREAVANMERKLDKSAFQCWIRMIYIFKKGEPISPGASKLLRTYLMGQFSSGKNYFVYWGATRTRIHYWFKERRLYLRKRQRLRNYIERMPSLWPRTLTGIPLFKKGFIRTTPGIRGTCILSTEELATIFHFPVKITVPTVPRVEVKKVAPPPELEIPFKKAPPPPELPFQ